MEVPPEVPVITTQETLPPSAPETELPVELPDTVPVPGQQVPSNQLEDIYMHF